MGSGSPQPAVSISSQASVRWERLIPLSLSGVIPATAHLRRLFSPSVKIGDNLRMNVVESANHKAVNNQQRCERERTYWVHDSPGPEQFMLGGEEGHQYVP